MENKEHLQQLVEIRSMMERSSRFISLSGLSGVLAGTYALMGAAFVKYYPWMQGTDLLIYLIVAAAVILLSLITGYLLTRRRAMVKGEKLLNRIALRMLINLAIPMITGGVFTLILLFRQNLDLIAPVMLMFYGLALINGSKYTLDDIRYLGVLELVLGIVCALNPENGLMYWALGFGVLHILYGARMWWKYERPAADGSSMN